jgi:hypothetical protein
MVEDGQVKGGMGVLSRRDEVVAVDRSRAECWCGGGGRRELTHAPLYFSAGP